MILILYAFFIVIGKYLIRGISLYKAKGYFWIFNNYGLC